MSVMSINASLFWNEFSAFYWSGVIWKGHIKKSLRTRSRGTSSCKLVTLKLVILTSDMMEYELALGFFNHFCIYIYIYIYTCTHRMTCNNIIVHI